MLTGLLARELGGGRSAQLLAAASIAVSAILLATGHLLSTTTFDLLAWTALSWLLVRALRDGGPGWLAVGAVAGLALQNKLHPAFLLAGRRSAILTVGPRAALRSPWPWLGGLVALVLWAPNLVWQAANGWPQLELSRKRSPRAARHERALVPVPAVPARDGQPAARPDVGDRLVAAGPRPGLRTWRAFAVAYVVLAVLFLVTGGKPYYLAGLYPVLLAAGADPVVDWSAPGTAGPHRSGAGRDRPQPGDQRRPDAAARAGGTAGRNPDRRRELRRRRDRRLAAPSPPRSRRCGRTCRPARRSPSSPPTTGRPARSTGSPRCWARPTAGTTPTGPGVRRRRTSTP